ncbi:serine/threonine-protein kinase [Streptomyces sp. NEAU-W12]|uniref:serine/threonine-protein kinase n=1 Tax=Streptomyces sp. NEAU-W12 TaxID=2994668 RepID=UPI00224A6DBF|nr:serine/threonine-protein kinase [Streptomyces sp. NEAU-W12]MCX2927245.1 protein kinase [Streptomyces sp. NEAU-W12]
MSNDGGATDARGRLVGGRYRLIEQIGSGGMGTVWRALDELVQREVAVKQPRLPGHPGDERHRRAAHRLHREARAAARVDHPAAVAIHDVVVEDDGIKEPEGRDGTNGLPWIVMELVRGESLHELLERGPLPPAETARIGLAVLGALRAAHAVGIVHRDVKPANVLLGPHRRVVLTDFGIAHVQGEESLTASGEFIGSLEFVAPERMSGRLAGPASDLWSLGVLLYAAVEGWSPFRRTTLESTLAAIITEDTPEPKQAGGLGPLIVRLLAKEPEDRPDAEEVAAELEAATIRWPEPASTASGARSQDASGMRELADDAGTVRLGGSGAARVPVPAPAPALDEGPHVPEPRPEPGPESIPEPIPEPGPESESMSESRPDVSESESKSDPESIPESESRPDVSELTPESEPESESAPAPGTSDPGTPGRGTPVLPPLARRLLRPAPVAALGALLVGGAWSAAALVSDTEAATGRTPPASASATPMSTPTAAPASPLWTAHRETAMAAVLSLPHDYQEFARQGGARDQPRIVVYGFNDGNSRDSVDVRLTQWDRAPRSPMAQARQAHADWDAYEGDARTQYTRTSFEGHEAVLADTTYGPDELRVRVMQLMILVEGGRMYELRVDVPAGTPREKEGTAVFKGVRDRLEIGAVRSATP